MAEKEKKRVQVSLTEPLVGVEGEAIALVDAEGKEVGELSVRRAILVSLLQAENFLRQANKPPLSDREKIDAFILAQKVGNPESTGVTLSPEDIVLIKKVAFIRLPTEWLGALLMKIDPESLESK